MNFHRGKRNPKMGPTGQSLNEQQETISKTLQAYTSGQTNSKTLRSQLRNHNVEIDPQLDKPIRKHESGDFVSYHDLGKQVYRQING